MTDLKAQIEKLVGEWRSGKMGTDASVRVAELACADQLAAVLAGGEGERALEDKYLRCDEHSPAPFGTPSCLFCELTKRTAEIERLESRERALVEAGRAAEAWIRDRGAYVGDFDRLAKVYGDLVDALRPYPPSEKEGGKS